MDIPSEIFTNHILPYLDGRAVGRLEQTCKAMRDLLRARVLHPFQYIQSYGRIYGYGNECYEYLNRVRREYWGGDEHVGGFGQIKLIYNSTSARRIIELYPVITWKLISQMETLFKKDQATFMHVLSKLSDDQLRQFFNEYKGRVNHKVYLLAQHRFPISEIARDFPRLFHVYLQDIKYNLPGEYFVGRATSPRLCRIVLRYNRVVTIKECMEIFGKDIVMTELRMLFSSGNASEYLIHSVWRHSPELLSQLVSVMNGLQSYTLPYFMLKKYKFPAICYKHVPLPKLIGLIHKFDSLKFLERLIHRLIVPAASIPALAAHFGVGIDYFTYSIFGQLQHARAEEYYKLFLPNPPRELLKSYLVYSNKAEFSWLISNGCGCSPSTLFWRMKCGVSVKAAALVKYVENHRENIDWGRLYRAVGSRVKAIDALRRVFPEFDEVVRRDIPQIGPDEFFRMAYYYPEVTGTLEYYWKTTGEMLRKQVSYIARGILSERSLFHDYRERSITRWANYVIKWTDKYDALITQRLSPRGEYDLKLLYEKYGDNVKNMLSLNRHEAQSLFYGRSTGLIARLIQCGLKLKHK